MSTQISWLDYAKGLLAPVVAKGEPGEEWDRVLDMLEEWLSEEFWTELFAWLWTEHPVYMARARARIGTHLQRMVQSSSLAIVEHGLMKSGIKLQDAPVEVQAHYAYMYGEAAADIWDQNARTPIRVRAAEELEG